MKKIGICIPTYNRCAILLNNIKKMYISNKQTFDRGDAHFFISNDNSNDDTYRMLVKLNKQIKCITVSNMKKNLGFENNIGIVLNMCTYEYAWLLGDDDIIDININSVIEKLQINNPDFYVFGKTKINKRIFTNYNEVFNSLFLECTWMSSLIYKQSIIKNLDFNRYSLCEFPQTGAIFEYLPYHSFCFEYEYNEHAVHCIRKSTVSYADRILQIYAKGWSNLVLTLPAAYSYDDKLKLFKNRTRSSGMLNNKILLSLRAQKQFSSKLLKENYKYISLYNKTPYLILLLISNVPVIVCKWARILYAKVHKLELMEKG